MLSEDMRERETKKRKMIFWCCIAAIAVLFVVLLFVLIHFVKAKNHVDTFLERIEQSQSGKTTIGKLTDFSWEKGYCFLPYMSKEDMEKNLGFSAGNNIAYDYAVKHWDSSFVVFANNDLLFRDREFIRKVRGEYEKSHFGILSPDVFHTTLKIHQSPIDENMLLPKNRVRRTILFNTLALWFYPLYYALLGKNSKDVALSVTDLSYRKNIAPMGACLIFSRELMDRKPVIFSPETYFYYEEYILSFWCRKNNVDIVFQPDIQVLHNHGKATKSLGDHRRVMKFRMKNILQAAKVYYRLLKEEDI